MTRGNQHRPVRSDPYRAIGELSVTVAGLLLIVGFAPLGSESFPLVCGCACAGVVSYAIAQMCLRQGVIERWGLFPIDETEGCVVGCLWLCGLFLTSLVPMAFVWLYIETPRLATPLTYLIWCAIQDFIFFVLICRNLEELTHPILAILLTAGLFGLSHYPFEEFMWLTGLMGLIWGAFYVWKRSLIFITCLHWMMGMIVVG